VRDDQNVHDDEASHADEPATRRHRPLLCRLGLHDWPKTFLPGAGPVSCLRCGKRRRRRPWSWPG
jgi:hypothetical protein